MKKILIVCYNNLAADPRVQRQIEALKTNYTIETLAYSDCGDSDIPNHQIYQEPEQNYSRKFKRLFQLVFRNYEQYYWDDYKKSLVTTLSQNNYDLIIANDIKTLGLALAIANKKSKVLFDSHDFHPNEFDDNLMWRIRDKRFINFLCKTYIPKADFFMTSSNSIAQEYQTYINRLPVVINNAREYFDLTPSEAGNPIKLIHHGAAIKGRKLENMIDIAKQLGPNFQLTFMLTNANDPYYDFLKNYAKELPHVIFKEPVSFLAIVGELNKHDIGIYHLEETNINNANLLPNKIFEFIQARLCCIVSPTRELKTIVNENQIGVVAPDFSTESMAKIIKELSLEQIQSYKARCQQAAKELSSEQNIVKIREIVKGLLA